MTLGFMQKFPWKVNGQPEPTNFREKILTGVGQNFAQIQQVKIVRNTTVSGGYSPARSVSTEHKAFEMGSLALFSPKLHTIREDKHNRWKAGRKIEMVYRGPKYSILSHFNKGIPELEKCVSTQKVEIKWLTPEQEAKMKGTTYFNPEIYIDGRLLTIAQQSKLAINDGFTDDADLRNGKFALQKFLKWFDKSCTMKILHWTDLRY